MNRDLRVVIVGGDDLGTITARRLDNRGHDVVVVERDERRAQQLSDEYVATVIHGDSERPSLLRQAQLDRADVIAALADTSAMANIGVCLTAERIAPDIKTVARVDHDDTAEYRELVDAVVYPEELAAATAANDVVKVGGGTVQTIDQLSAALELVEIEVTEDAPAANKPLRAVSFPRGTVVVAERNTDDLPGPEMVLDPGRQYVLAVQTDVTDEVLRLLRG